MTTDSEVWSLRHKEPRKKVSLTLIISFCLRVNEHSSLTVQSDIILGNNEICSRKEITDYFFPSLYDQC